MVKIDLITGFLGSGKTTFIRRYAAWLVEQGQNIGILENDYGAVNVDMMLLQDLMGEHCELEMISGGCCQDCHRRRFKTKLIAMGMSGYDRVLIEPSGIFDMDEFFDILHEEPLDRWYEIGNVIAVVDARLENELSEEADFILASEVAEAGRIVLSRTQEASEQEIADTIAHVNRALEQVQCSRRFQNDILCRDWSELTGADFAELSACGYVNAAYRKKSFGEEGFQSVCFMNVRMTEEQLRAAVEQIFLDPACGNVFRVKGFLRAGENGWLQLNATQREITIRPIKAGQEVLIVIGEALAEPVLETYLRKSGA